MSVPYPDVFWAYRILEVKDRIVSDTPNPPMTVTEGPKIFDVQCIWGRIFMCLEKICVFK